MEIQLNEERTSMWGLLDTDIFLTAPKPGPVSLEWETLSPRQQVALRAALLQEQVMRTDAGGIPELNIPKEEEKGEPVISRPFCQEIATQQQIMVADIDTMAASRQRERANLEKDAKSLLCKHAGKIRISLAKATLAHMPLLLTMRQLEENKKRTRKKVLQIIVDTIKRIQLQAAEAIESSTKEESGARYKQYKEPELPEEVEITALHTETGDTVTFNPATGEIKRN